MARSLGILDLQVAKKSLQQAELLIFKRAAWLVHLVYLICLSQKKSFTTSSNSIQQGVASNFSPKRSSDRGAGWRNDKHKTCRIVGCDSATITIVGFPMIAHNACAEKWQKSASHPSYGHGSSKDTREVANRKLRKVGEQT